MFGALGSLRNMFGTVGFLAPAPTVVRLLGRLRWEPMPPMRHVACLQSQRSTAMADLITSLTHN